jgi:hypothetical protein
VKANQQEPKGESNNTGLSRRGVLNILKGLGLGVGAAVIAGRDAVAAFAQKITGALGSPGATTTLDGRQLPPPDPKFGGTIEENAAQSKPWWAPRVARPTCSSS